MTESKESNFQIQYFPVDKREEYKEWCHSHKLSMKDMMLQILDNKDKISFLIKDK